LYEKNLTIITWMMNVDCLRNDLEVQLNSYHEHHSKWYQDITAFAAKGRGGRNAIIMMYVIPSFFLFKQ